MESTPYPSAEARRLIEIVRNADASGLRAYLKEHPLDSLHFGIESPVDGLHKAQATQKKKELIGILLDNAWPIDEIHKARRAMHSSARSSRPMRWTRPPGSSSTRRA